jgi:hypothetical protein
MKRVLLTVAVALLIPGLLGAAPATMGVYVDGKLHYTPAAPLSFFDMYLYLVQSDYFVTAVEYQLVRPNGNFVLTGVSYPDNFSIELGDPLSGHAITFWPPMTGYPTGYDLLATYHCMTLLPCENMPNYPLTIGVNPGSGELRGTYSPDNDFFSIIGLTTYLCPDGVANEAGSWGTIKSLYR